MENENATFSLVDVIDAIESASLESRYFANKHTGKTAWINDYHSPFDEIDEDELEGDGWIALPGSYERNDWSVMRDFACAIGGPEEDELLDAIHGRGAFRNFRFTVERMGALESWYAYKDEAMCQLAVEWLKKNGLSWEDDRRDNQKRDWYALLPATIRERLQLVVLDAPMSVCKLEALPDDLMDEGFCSITWTADELSVVCETSRVPDRTLAREDGWRALKVLGPLDFGLVGILAKISAALAQANVPLFAISTYDTDYILVKEACLEPAIAALRKSGCDVILP